MSRVIEAPKAKTEVHIGRLYEIPSGKTIFPYKWGRGEIGFIVTGSFFAKGVSGTRNRSKLYSPTELGKVYRDGHYTLNPGDVFSCYANVAIPIINFEPRAGVEPAT